MIHHFPFDPRAVLGVSAGATAEEIHDAFREKSKKHHPDMGGDEWAFRIVARAFEVLQATADGDPAPPSPVAAATSAPWTSSAAGPGFFFTQERFPFNFGSGGGDETDADVETRAEPPGIFQQVEVELIWIRFATAAEDAEGSTLSVCMVVSWPLRSAVARAAEYADLGATLRWVIDAFDVARQSGPLAARPRIEDGQFVGWLSFPDVPAAQSAFLRLRDALRRRGLSVHLQTRDEIIPENWSG